MVIPVALTLEARQDRVMSQGFLSKALPPEFAAADHKVPDNDGHLDAGLPDFVLAPATVLFCGGIVVGSLHAISPGPFQSTPILGAGVDPLLKTADQLGHIHVFVPHSQVFLEKILIDDGADDAHGNRAYGKVAFPAHPGRRG